MATTRDLLDSAWILLFDAAAQEKNQKLATRIYRAMARVDDARALCLIVDLLGRKEE